MGDANEEKRGLEQLSDEILSQIVEKAVENQEMSEPESVGLAAFRELQRRTPQQ